MIILVFCASFSRGAFFDMIYLDNSSTTFVSPKVVQTIFEAMQEFPGNPSSLHSLGARANQKLESCRKQVAELIDSGDGKVFFAGSGTEADNLALFGHANARKRRGNRIVTCTWEHDAVLQPLRALKEQGFEVVLQDPEKNGELDIEKLAYHADEKTILVTVMLVNNETGAVADIRKLSRLVRAKSPNAAIHCDCVAAFGKLRFSAHELGADSVALSGHKIHAPKGIGALWLKKGVRLSPLFLGGGQEQSIRPGTENLAYITGFAAACEEAVLQQSKNFTNTSQLRQILDNQLKNIDSIRINSPLSASPYICNISVPGYKSESMLHYLDQKGIQVSSGSACSGGKKSHVLSSMGLSPALIDSALRISFCAANTSSDVFALAEALKSGINELVKAR